MNWIEESALEVLIEKLFPIYFEQVLKKIISSEMMVLNIKNDLRKSFPSEAGKKDFDIKVMEIIIKICHDKNESERGDNNGKTAN